MKQSLAHGARQYVSFVSASHSDCSFAADDRKIHTIHDIRFSDGIVPLGVQTRLFERAPKEILLTRAEKQIVDLPRLVESFAVGQNERDPAQAAAGDGVGKLDQLVTAHLRVPSDAERILAKGLGETIKPLYTLGNIGTHD